MGVISKTTEEINTLLDKVEGMPDEGVSGKTPVLETGSTITLDPGQNATSEVVANGTDESGNPKYKINFGIPRGADGSGGSGGGTADNVEWKNVLNKPTWVNSFTKPTYTATEVGALPAATIIPSKTSQLSNDSGYVTSSTLKTINGQSIVGEGNIEISGAGSGIADAPSDGQIYGRKNGNWSAITGGTGGSVDISEIFNRIGQIAEIGGTCTDEDYNTLKEYAENGVVTYADVGGTVLKIDLMTASGSISIGYSMLSGDIYINVAAYISEDKHASLQSGMFFPYNKTGEAAIGESYSKPSSYSEINPSDTIATAIGKLEAGIGTGGSSDDIYYLPTDVLTLDAQATKEEIEAAFGGLDKKTELINAIKAGKKIYIQGNELFSSVHVMALNSFYIQAYITFIRRINVFSDEIVNIKFANSSAIRVINAIGYKVDSRVNLLTSSSTTDEISTALGGIEGVKKLKKAVEDGNSIYTTFYSGSSTEITSARLNLSVVIISDESKYEITICGVQGEGFLIGLNVGYLYITYEISSNTFTCQRYNNTGIS